MNFRARRPCFVVVFGVLASLIGCSTNGANPLGAGDAGPSAADCPCNPLNASGSALAETSLACFCGASGCQAYAAAVAEFCQGPNASYFKVTESLFDGCGLRVLTIAGQLSGGTNVYDSASGALLGGSWQGDVAQQCPATKREHLGFAAGAYAVPPSCQRTSQRDLCGGAGRGGDAGARD